jgi:RNA polymerase sigma factor (sigma-70 family)
MTADPACWDDAVPGLRTRLVRRARRLGVDAEGAEDLAQEALYEAWRLRDRLHDPAGIERWLLAILGNVHRRWVRRQGQERSRRAEDPARSAGLESAELDLPADERFDVEVELERRELADLLDRAMALLPPETRDLLVQRFVDETPMSELATRWGMSQGAVQMRVQRGKLALHRVLTGTYADDAVAFGLIGETEAGWQETRIWCPVCGEGRMQGRFKDQRSEFELRCLQCGNFRMRDVNVQGYGVTGFRATLKRLSSMCFDAWHDGMPGVHAHPHRMTLRRWVNPDGSDQVLAACSACESNWATTLDGLALFSPAGQQFWREHPRIRRVAYQDLEAGGVPAVLTSYRSVTAESRLDVVLTRDTFHVVRTHRS